MQSCRSSKPKLWRLTCTTYCRMSAETPVLPVTPSVAAIYYGTTSTNCCCSGEQGYEVLCASCSSDLWQLAPEKLMFSMTFLKNLQLLVCSGWGFAQLTQFLVAYPRSLECFSFPKGGGFVKHSKHMPFLCRWGAENGSCILDHRILALDVPPQDFQMYGVKAIPKKCNKMYEFWLMHFMFPLSSKSSFGLNENYGVIFSMGILWDLWGFLLFFRTHISTPNSIL